MQWQDFLDYASQMGYEEFLQAYKHSSVTTSIKIPLGDRKDRPTRLNIVKSQEAEDTDIFFLNSNLVLGRESKCSIRYSCEEVSRSHAKLKCLAMDGGRWAVSDCCSKNGTYVNGIPVKITPHCLQNGDVIKLGKNTKLVYRTIDGLWEAVAAIKKISLEECFV